jgi:hypothetical protein
MQDAGNFVAAQVFPNIPVQNKSDLYFTYDRGEFNRDEMRERADGAESAGGAYTIAENNYSARVYAFHKDIGDQTRSNADAPLSPDIEATKFCTMKALIRRENIWATKFFNQNIWTTTVTGVTSTPSSGQVWKWGVAQYANSNPGQDVRTAKGVILQSTGFEPNILVLGYQVYQALVDHPILTDRIKYQGTPGSPATVNAKTMAQFFEVDKVLVMKAIYNAAKEGQPNNHQFIGANNALLCYAAPEPGIMTPSAGYTFSWNGYLGAGLMGNRIKQFRMEELASDRVEIEMAFDMNLVGADLGYFFYNMT